MPFFDPIRIGSSGAVSDFTIDRSIRLNDADTPFLQRGVSSASNRKTFTYSVWCKRTENSSTYSGNAANCLFYQGDTSGNEFFMLTFNGEDKIFLQQYDYPTNQGRKVTTQVFRDPSAWYHIVLRVDTTNSTADDRLRLYVNGEQVTDFVTNDGTTSQNLDTWVNDTTFDQYIGKAGYNNLYMDGYLAEINMVDGSSLAPSSFGETNSETGQWVPIDTSGLTFGTNGFRLKFLDNSGTTATTLGKDSSGNANNFTPNNFSVATGIGNDSVTDTPTNNFCTLNSVDMSGNALEQANLQGGTAGTAGWRHTRSTFALPSSGKWYWEYKLPDASSDGSNGHMMGVAYSNLGFTQDINSDSTGLYGRQGDSKYNNSSSSPVTGSHFTTIANNDIIQFAYDADSQKLYTGKNNTWELSADPSAGSNPNWTSVASGGFPMVGSYGSSRYVTVNFGQQGFVYTPPTGFKALSSQNLPDPTILLPASHFNTLVFTGNQSTNAQTGLDFQPDWIVYKALNPETGHGETKLHDSVRGPTKGSAIRPYNNETPPAEVTNSAYLVSFDSNGFTVGNDSVYNNYQTYNQTGRTYQALCWNGGDSEGKTYTVTVVSDSGNKYRFDGYGTSAVTLDLAEGGTYIFNYPSAHPLKFSTTSDGTHGGGSEYTTGVTHNSSTQVTIVVPASAPTLYYYCSIHSGMGGQVNTNSTLGSSNFDGSIQSTVKANTTAGLSILTYTGTGSAGATVGHGLGVTPQVIIIKNRTLTTGNFWCTYHHKSFNSASDPNMLYLNQNAPEADDTNVLGTSVTIDSSKFSLGDYNGSNYNGGGHFAYCFNEVEGYSKFGIYNANSSSNGPFAFCGFEPAFLLIKRKTSGDNNPWIGYNNVRNPFNQVNNQMVWNTTEHENIDADNCNLDFLSNGFKLRNSDGTFNNSTNNGQYIFLAFAHSPFKNGRAR